MFHERIKKLHKESGVTQSELAKKLNISTQALSYIINGREPKYDLLIKIAEFYRVPVDYLLGVVDYPDETIAIKVQKEIDSLLRSDNHRDRVYLVTAMGNITQAVDYLKESNFVSEDVITRTISDISENILKCCSYASDVSDRIESWGKSGVQGPEYSDYTKEQTWLMVRIKNELYEIVDALIESIREETLEKLYDLYLSKGWDTSDSNSNLWKPLLKDETRKTNMYMKDSNIVKPGDYDG